MTNSVYDSLDDSDAGIEQTAPVWAVFGDLMSGLLGAFVLILVGVLGVQMELTSHLENEVKIGFKTTLFAHGVFFKTGLIVKLGC